MERVRARVHEPAIDVLGPVVDPRNVHQSKFSMGFVLAQIAHRGGAGLDLFTEESLHDPDLRDFLPRVEMVLDPEVDAAYPERWIGLVEVDTTDGRHLVSRVDVPKGDPGNPLSRAEIEDKAHRLAVHGGGVAPEEVDRLVARAWALEHEPDVRDLLGPAGSR